MRQGNARLGEILKKKGWIEEGQLEEALHEQKSTREFLGRILVQKKYLNEEQLAQVLAEQFQLPLARPKNFYVDWDLAMRFSASLILEQRCFPLFQEAASMTMGITNPLNAWAMGQIEEEARGSRVKFALLLESEMQELLDRYRERVNIRIRHQLNQGG